MATKLKRTDRPASEWLVHDTDDVKLELAGWIHDERYLEIDVYDHGSKKWIVTIIDLESPARVAITANLKRDALRMALEQMDIAVAVPA